MVTGSLEAGKEKDVFKQVTIDELLAKFHEDIVGEKQRKVIQYDVPDHVISNFEKALKEGKIVGRPIPEKTFRFKTDRIATIWQNVVSDYSQQYQPHITDPDNYRHLQTRTIRNEAGKTGFLQRRLQLRPSDVAYYQTRGDVLAPLLYSDAVYTGLHVLMPCASKIFLYPQDHKYLGPEAAAPDPKAARTRIIIDIDELDSTRVIEFLKLHKTHHLEISASIDHQIAREMLIALTQSCPDNPTDMLDNLQRAIPKKYALTAPKK